MEIDFAKVQSKYRIIGKRFNVRLNIRKTSDHQNENVMLTKRMWISFDAAK